MERLGRQGDLGARSARLALSPPALPSPRWPARRADHRRGKAADPSCAKSVSFARRQSSSSASRCPAIVTFQPRFDLSAANSGDARCPPTVLGRICSMRDCRSVRGSWQRCAPAPRLCPQHRAARVRITPMPDNGSLANLTRSGPGLRAHAAATMVRGSLRPQR